MALIYCVNTNEQVLAVGDTISFGSVARRSGCGYGISGGNVTTNIRGLHRVSTNITFTAGATGVVTITLYKNGIAIPGAKIKMNVANANEYTVNLADVVTRSTCCDAAITAVVTGVAITVNNATMTATV